MAQPRQSRSQSSSTGSNADILSINDAIDRLLDIDGAIGAAIVDYESGMTLGTGGGRDLDMELAGAGNTEVVRSKKNILEDLGVNDRIQDLLISLEAQYHLIRMCERHDDIFIYVVIDRNRGNLGLARRMIDQIDKKLELE
ncbi:hypothetical protein [Salinibacter sp. 10B]|uniref:hypothetical protein n=1 Tax=Salinibacter sp. 10B TaxID=1923971 RepID=UPI001C615EA7|nr:hypothetical protein [Salinibacter sp. 10B]